MSPRRMPRSAPARPQASPGEAMPEARAAEPSGPRHVRIDIARLSLHGYTREQQQRFLRTLEAELKAQASAPREMALASRSVARIEPLPAAAQATPEGAARLLARRLCAGLYRHDTEATHV